METDSVEIVPGRPACKSCGTPVSVSPEEIEKIFGGLRVKQVKLTDREEYGRRLSVCTSCTDLMTGSTCRHCGCLVEVRAKLVVADCPSPAGSRWRP